MKKIKNNEIILSVLIPTYNRKKDLKLVVKSLLEQDFNKKKLEIIVIDNGPSNDGTDLYMKQIEAKYPYIKYIKTNKKGCILAQNIGLNAAKGDIILNIDDDIEFINKNALSIIVSDFQNNNIAIVGGLELSFFKKKHHKNSNSEFLNIGNVSKWGEFSSDFEKLDGQTNLFDVMQFRSCCMAIRKEILIELGGFNTLYNYNGQAFRYETDLCFRASKYGRILIDPNVRIWHKASERGSGVERGLNKKNIYLNNRNHMFFMLTFFWKDKPLIWIIFDILIGNYRTPGFFYLLRRKIFDVTLLLSMVRGKVDGVKLFRSNK